MLLQRDPTTDNPVGKDLHAIGTASAVLRYVTTGDGSQHLIVQGLERFRVREFLPGYDFLVARVERLPVVSAKLTPALEVRMERLRELTLEALRLVPGAPQEMADALRNIDSASALADLVASTLDLHIHVPAGAIPKDGPSAGVTMFVALVSLLDARTVHSDLAMTGEISLRGLVLPVGGIKEKVLAAARAGINTVLLPARNRKDLPDIPMHVQERLRFVWLEHVDDAIETALPPPKTRQARSPCRLRSNGASC